MNLTRQTDQQKVVMKKPSVDIILTQVGSVSCIRRDGGETINLILGDPFEDL